MPKYIAKYDKIVSCIYGTRPLTKGLPVDEFIAKKFPQYVEIVPEEINTIEEVDTTINQEEIKQGKRKE